MISRQAFLIGLAVSIFKSNFEIVKAFNKNICGLQNTLSAVNFTRFRITLYFTDTQHKIQFILDPLFKVSGK